MPYSSPSDQSQNSVYRLSVALATNQEVKFDIYFEIDQGISTPLSETEADDVVQLMMDLLNSSSDFASPTGLKNYQTGQAITPTP